MTEPQTALTDPNDVEISESELTPAAQIGAVLFRNRGWLPVVFLAVPLLLPGTTSWRRWIMGALLIIAGEAFRLAGVAAAGTTTRRRSRNVSELVTHGAFAWSRNPLYNGNFLIWMGFVVISGVMWFLPFAMLLYALEYSLIVRYEEGVLESIFGREYLEYKQCTPRWVPSKPKLESSGELRWREAFKSEISTFGAYLVLIIAFIVKAQFVS
ncbi:MAG TPA: isoprenylcysteine carboxylmethyltransferase family protein [Gemmatimonadaceae bacterium]|jgi:protein-S-isoprenylcysteine O-methyltransferase Ste14|nr:isoprenylcysteine carboxylmethyltransferase family protein [Gemmatimonadaceae bacterium]